MPTKKSTRKTSSTRRSSSKTQTFRVKGAALFKKVRSLIKEGNVRRITIIDKNGKELIVLPLTVGVVGVVLAPALAAIGALAALVTECSIKVERTK